VASKTTTDIQKKGTSRRGLKRAAKARGSKAPGRGHPVTKAHLAYFLNELMQYPCVSSAALAAGIGREPLYRRRHEDADFAKAWEEAKAIGAEAAYEEEANRRAIHGVDEPVIYKGEMQYRIDHTTGLPMLDENDEPIPLTVRRPSDTLLIFLMKGANPGKYRDGPQTNLNLAVGVKIVVTGDDTRL